VPEKFKNTRGFMVVGCVSDVEGDDKYLANLKASIQEFRGEIRFSSLNLMENRRYAEWLIGGRLTATEGKLATNPPMPRVPNHTLIFLLDGQYIDSTAWLHTASSMQDWIAGVRGKWLADYVERLYQRVAPSRSDEDIVLTGLPSLYSNHISEPALELGQSAPAAVDRLISVLTDPKMVDHGNTLVNALQVLGSIRPQSETRRGVPAVVKLLATDKRRQAFRCLSRMGPAAVDAVPALVKELEQYTVTPEVLSYDHMVNEMALVCRALVAIGPEAGPALPILQQIAGSAFPRMAGQGPFPPGVWADDSIVYQMGLPAAVTLSKIERPLPAESGEGFGEVAGYCGPFLSGRPNSRELVPGGEVILWRRDKAYVVNVDQAGKYRFRVPAGRYVLTCAKHGCGIFDHAGYGGLFLPAIKRVDIVANETLQIDLATRSIVCGDPFGNLPSPGSTK
jgi:hypothetical protein